MYQQVKADLQRVYDLKVQEREGMHTAAWKEAERRDFLSLLQQEGKQTLLEIGAGTGVHGLFFQDNGMEVVCTDLSPAMVASCQKKGLTAYAMDFLGLDFPDETFDAVFAMNCLLHVPHADFGRVLDSIRRVMRPAGLLFLGQYGGIDREGPWEEDNYEPRRFFSFWTEEQMQEQVEAVLEVETFKVIQLEDEKLNIHFQALVLRRGEQFLPKISLPQQS
jgi:SAM-dependent methyltransferase